MSLRQDSDQGENLARRCWLLCWLSFIPGMHFVTLWYVKRYRSMSETRYSLRVELAMALGLFFSAVYLLAGLGYALRMSRGLPIFFNISDALMAQLQINRIDPSVNMGARVLGLLVLVFMVCLHEFGHGYAADRAGDHTARSMGRLSLNPLVHIDLFGTILLPAILYITHSPFFFGWAKPVPVNPRNYADPAKDELRVSFAGVATGFYMAMGAVVLLMLTGLGIRMAWPMAVTSNFGMFFGSTAIAGIPGAMYVGAWVIMLKQVIIYGLLLGLFNLIPIPPLDGSWIFSRFLPHNLRVRYEQLRPYGMIILLVMIYTNVHVYVIQLPLLVFGQLLYWLITLGIGLT